MSAWTRRSSTARPTNRLFRLVLESHDGKAPGADSEEKHEPASDIDIALMDSLKVLDPKWPIREADIGRKPGCSDARPPMRSAGNRTAIADSLRAMRPAREAPRLHHQRCGR